MMVEVFLMWISFVASSRLRFVGSSDPRHHYSEYVIVWIIEHLGEVAWMVERVQEICDSSELGSIFNDIGIKILGLRLKIGRMTMMKRYSLVTWHKVI